MKLHIDTDIAGDIDDLCALAMVLNWPGVELIAITTVADDVGRRAGYARYVLALAGRNNIPVASGADVVLDCYSQKPGFPAEHDYWPDPVPPSPTTVEVALDLLETSIAQGAVIAAIGPFTNLALLEKRSPGILREARLFLMGGYVFPPRKGFPSWDSDSDYNVQVDVESAQCVLEHSNPTIVSLSVTVQTALRRAWLNRLNESGPLAQLIARQAEAFARDEGYELLIGQTCSALPPDIINFLHDPLACAIAVGWEEDVKFVELPIRFELESGLLRSRVEPSGRPTKVVSDVNGAKFGEFWLQRVTES